MRLHLANPAAPATQDRLSKYLSLPDKMRLWCKNLFEETNALAETIFEVAVPRMKNAFE